MAKGEGNVGHRVDEDLPSTYEEALLRADATGAITWLITIRKSGADAFWKKFSFPPNVQVSFPSSRPHYVDCTYEDQGRMNSIY